jgi:hypothetical protein
MLFKTIFAAAFGAALVAAQTNSDVVAVFILGRHGDRTSKIFGLGIEGSSVLTTLGANEVSESATFFRNYYLNSTSDNAIVNASSNFIFGQIYASAP